MREFCTSGSVGGEGGNILTYPADTHLRFESTQMLKRVSIALLSGPSKPSVVASSAYSQFD